MGRLFWISQPNPKCTDKNAHERKAEGEDSVVREVDPGVKVPQAKECQQPPEARKDKEQILPLAPVGSVTLWIPKFLLYEATKFAEICYSDHKKQDTESKELFPKHFWESQLQVLVRMTQMEGTSTIKKLRSKLEPHRKAR